jgi:hypothetical protein
MTPREQSAANLAEALKLVEVPEWVDAMPERREDRCRLLCDIWIDYVRINIPIARLPIVIEKLTEARKLIQEAMDDD